MVDSDILHDTFDLRVMPMRFASDLKDIGRFDFGKLTKSFRLLSDLKREMKTNRPDLVLFSFSPTGFAFWRDVMLARTVIQSGVKLLHFLHGKGLVSTIRNRQARRQAEYVFERSLSICLSPLLYADIQAVSPSQPYIVNYGIEVVREAEVVREGREGPIRLLFLSNYHKTKGIFELLDAVALLQHELRFELRIVGKPTASLSLEEIERYSNALKLGDRVKVTGPKYGQEKWEQYEWADVFVLPTAYHKEAFPLVLLEAMQFGLPIVSTTEGAIPDIVTNGSTGYLVKPHDVFQLSHWIKHLANQPTIRQMMGAKGREKFFQRFTLRHFEWNLKAAIESELP